jgi:anti-sigma factor RsiW
MNHEQIRSELSELRDGELPESRRAELSRHAAECASCRAELADWERLTRAFLRPVPAPTAFETERFVRSVMAKLPEAETARPSLWALLTGAPLLTPALGLASVALALSFVPFGSRASARAVVAPLFVADGQEIALAPAPALRAGVSEAVGVPDESR